MVGTKIKNAAKESFVHAFFMAAGEAVRVECGGGFYVCFVCNPSGFIYIMVKIEYK